MSGAPEERRERSRLRSPKTATGVVRETSEVAVHPTRPAPEAMPARPAPEAMDV
ncbi:MAG: hypothetical protein M3N32_11830 [Actinomycetota bacterium]|nr:hypothetical protein [Actinomycetota bacterium]